MSFEGAADRAEQASTRIGSVVDGHWSIDALLGIGGMAAVYAASAGRERVAIKVLQPELTRSQRALDRFRREADALRAARHPAVPRLLGEGETVDGSPYLVMELLLGETLEARRRRFGGRMAHVEVVQVALVLLDVLVAIHGRGLLHRDVKPSNVLWLDDGTIRLIDFGIAKAPHTDEEMALTRTGALPGSLAFMSPEHALGVPSEVDARSDLWSLGATMFLLLSGRPVHESRTEVGALAMSATREAPSLGTVVNGLPQALVAVVDRALAFDREKRFADAAEMRDALMGVSSAPTRREPERARRPRLALAAGMLLVITGVAAWSSSNVHEERFDQSLHLAARPTEPGAAGAWVYSAGSSQPASTSAPTDVVTASGILPEPKSAPPATERPRARARPARIARGVPEQPDGSAPGASAATPSPPIPRCDPPFVVDPNTGTRRVKPGC